MKNEETYNISYARTQIRKQFINMRREKKEERNRTNDLKFQDSKKLMSTFYFKKKRKKNVEIHKYAKKWKYIEDIWKSTL